MSARRPGGFTLIELVTVLAVTGILSVVIWRNLAPPIEGFEDTTRRARLVDIAETALSRTTREIRLAVPNSLRTSAGGGTLELLRTIDGGRYRAQLTAAGSGHILDFNATSGTFDVLGSLSAQTVSYCSANTCQLVVYNLGGSGGLDAYTAANRATITALSANSVTFTGAAPFPLRSPQQRFQIVDTPVRFVCDTTAGTISRYANYAIGATPSGTPQILADQITACSFTYTAGTATRAGLVTVQLSVTAQGATGAAPETISLVDQVHIPNAP